MAEAIAFAALYVIGAMATMQCFIQGGYWREARNDVHGMIALWLLCAIWPVFIVCTTFTVVRKISKHKRTQAAKRGITQEKQG